MRFFFFVEVGEAQEGLHLLHRARDRPLEDGGHLGGIHANASLGHQVTDESHFWSIEFTLLNFGISLVVPENFQDGLDMFFALGRILRVDDVQRILVIPVGGIADLYEVLSASNTTSVFSHVQPTACVDGNVAELENVSDAVVSNRLGCRHR